MPSNIEKLKLIKSVLSRSTEGSIAGDQLNVNLRSQLSECFSLFGGDIRGLDLLLATQPAIKEQFNRKLKLEGYSTQLNYDSFQDEENLRSVVTSATPCEVVSCTDVIMEFIYCDKGMHSYMSKISSDKGCAVKVPLIPARAGSTPLVPSGSVIPVATGLADDKCMTVTPEKYGEYLTLDIRSLECNTCVDRIALKMKQLAQRVSLAMSNLAAAKVIATGTNVPASGTLLATVQDMSDAIKANIQTAGALTYFVAPIVFDQLLRQTDASGRAIIDPMSIPCDGKCREICFQGNKYVELDTIPVTANQSTIYTGYFDYASHIVSSVNSVECQDCADKMNDVVKIGNVFYQEVVIPTDFAAAFAYSVITV
jgi:hypothetical protein